MGKQSHIENVTTLKVSEIMDSLNAVDLQIMDTIECRLTYLIGMPS